MFVDCRHMLKRIIEPDPKQRISLADIEHHPWITRNGKLPFTPYVPQPTDKNMKNQVSYTRSQSLNSLFLNQWKLWWYLGLTLNLFCMVLKPVLILFSVLCNSSLETILDIIQVLLMFSSPKAKQIDFDSPLGFIRLLLSSSKQFLHWKWVAPQRTRQTPRTKHTYGRRQTFLLKTGCAVPLRGFLCVRREGCLKSSVTRY